MLYLNSSHQLKKKKHFENFKKRYQKTKNALSKAGISGIGSVIVGKAQRDFQPYFFLNLMNTRGNKHPKVIWQIAKMVLKK